MFRTRNAMDDKTLLTCLAVACPMGGNPEDCHMYALRQKSLGERVVYIDSLTPQERAEDLERHWACLARKLYAS